MNTVLFKWPLLFAIAAGFCISTVVQLEGQSPCWKADVYDRAPAPRDATSAGGGHPSIGSLPPDTALENIKVSASLTDTLEKSGIAVPEGGLKTACSRFKDLRQCIVAMHVAKNLNLSFGDLQRKMTGANSLNLDKAIQSLAKRDVNAKNEAKKAKKQTNQDLRMAEPRA